LQNDYHNSTIALAGIIQAVSLVRDLAQTGKADEASFQSSIHSIFETDPKDINSVYNGLHGIRCGLENLIQIFSDNPKQSRPLMRYAMSLIHLQKKITRTNQVLNTLKQRIQQTKKQVEYFSLTHPVVIANLADIYLNTISTFRFRIMIWGNSRVLNTPEVMEKIRALLLAGIRSAVLWRQMGGSRLQLLFSRAKIRATAETILQQKEHV